MFSDGQLLLWAILLIVAGLVIHYVRRLNHADVWQPTPKPQSSRPALGEDLFENALVGYLQMDREGIVRRVNRKECELRGLPAPEVLGTHCADLNPASSKEQYRRELERKLSEQVSLFPYQRKLVRPDGTVLTTEVHETLLRNNRGRVIGIRSATMDITDHQRIEERALETASELKALFQAFPDLFLRLDAEGNVVDCKGGTTKDSWLAPQTFSGRRLQDILPGSAARLLIEAAAKVRRTNSVEIVEYSTEGRHGPQFYECRMLPLYWDHAVAVLRNITDRKATESELRRYAQELDCKNQELESALTAREATKLKSQFLANMSHEIRTPMNGVLGMGEFLLGTELSPEQREYAESIKRSADSLLGVINDILDLSKIEAGKLRLDQIPFHLGVTVEEVTSLFTVRARAKGLDFRSAIPPDIPWRVVGDPGRVRQVLTNLLGNAIKFTDRGRVSIGMELLREATDSLTVKFTVGDTGPGIAREQQRLLFQSFTQLDGSNTRKYGGTGLGLAISKQLVELLGGEIGVKSEPGRGSTFWFTAIFEKQALLQPQEREPATISLKDLRVLIAGSLSISALVKQLLDAQGFQSLEVSSGEAIVPALRGAVAEGNPVRLALLDIDLPDLNGVEVARAIKSEPMVGDILLIAMTSSPLHGDGSELRERGFAGYLHKPIQASALYNTFAEVLKAPQACPAPLVPCHTLREQQVLRPSRASRVLLAEDNQVNQRITLRLLEKLGLPADAVVNGREAVEAMGKKDYDLVLMDCQMPEMDGFEAVAIIRNKERNVRHTPICALTANAMEGDRERCLAAGMDDYVSKPIGLEQLQETIDRWVPRELRSCPTPKCSTTALRVEVTPRVVA